MSLFKCSQCGCIKNTAVGDYWVKVYKEKKDPLCSECSTGEWHGLFLKETPEEKGMIKYTDGFYWTPEEIKQLNY